MSSKRVVNSKEAPAPIGPYNQAILVNDTLYVSGQIAINASTGEMQMGTIEEETTMVLKNVQAVLKEAEMDFSNVVKSSVFLSDMNNFSKMNAVYADFFVEPFPARECVAVKTLPKNVNVEISVIAVR